MTDPRKITKAVLSKSAAFVCMAGKGEMMELPRRKTIRLKGYDYDTPDITS